MEEFLMNDTEARAFLQREWAAVLADPDPQPDPQVDALVNARFLSIRYAVVTQVLGKIARPERSLLALKPEAQEGGWYARRFARDVVVPWSDENDYVLGTSQDPYVSQPLRRPHLDDPLPELAREPWDLLRAFLRQLEAVDQAGLRTALRRILQSCARRVAY